MNNLLLLIRVKGPLNYSKAGGTEKASRLGLVMTNMNVL